MNYPTIDYTAEHKVSEQYLRSLEPYVRDVILGKKIPILSHLYMNSPIENFTSDMRKLDMTKLKKYERRQYEYKPALHWGQLKLFLGEVEFLNLVVESAGDAEVWFVYAGAAPGNHIEYLQKLFPKIHFELYDPNPFAIKENAMLKIYEQFFTDADAQYWKSKGVYLVLCSDIRSDPATPENVQRNMQTQLNWWKIMNPQLTMFKFRLPWEGGKTEYPAGDIYIQAYPGPTSTETRLVCKKDAPLITYDNTKYEEACFYHNKVCRSKQYKSKLGVVNLQRDGICMCYDCASFIHIMSDYLSVTKQKLDLKKIIKEVQQEISFGRGNLINHTIRNINAIFTTFTKSSYVSCGNAKCLICISGENAKYHRASRATIENEEEAQLKTQLIKETEKDYTFIDDL